MLSLPRDLLQPICDQLLPQDKAKLRLTCRELKSTLDPTVFCTLTLTVSNKELLKSLATGDTITKIPDFVQTLTIRHTSRSSASREPTKTTKRYLLQAIQSLRLLQTVNWKLNDHGGNLFIQDTILHALTSLEHLKELSLIVLSPFSRLQLEQLPRSLSSISITAATYVFERLATSLSELVARNTGLESLRVRLANVSFYPGSETPPPEFSTFAQQIPPSITNLYLSGWSISTDNQVIYPCFHSLSTLHVSGVHSEFWRSLQLANVQIRDLRNADINMPLLQYIASYSGLANLSLTDLYSETLPEIDGLASFFYEVVIPKHSMSLEELHICTLHHRQWCFNKAYSISISQCTGLRRFSISLDDSLHGMFEVTIQLLESIKLSYPSLLDLNITASNLSGQDGQKQYSWKHPEQSAETTLAEVQSAILTFGLTGPDHCNPHLRIHLTRKDPGYYYPEYRFQGEGDIAVNFCRYDPPPPIPMDYPAQQRSLWRRSRAAASIYYGIFKRAFGGS